MISYGEREAVRGALVHLLSVDKPLYACKDCAMLYIPWETCFHSAMEGKKMYSLIFLF